MWSGKLTEFRERRTDIAKCLQRLGALLKSCLQIIGLAQLDSDRFRSQLCPLGVSIRADGNVPASSGYWNAPGHQTLLRRGHL
jgi:hypothetical protein